MFAKQGIYKLHRGESLNLVAQYIVCIHITSEQKASGFLV